MILRPGAIVLILLIIIMALLIVDRRRLASLVESQKRMSDAELMRRKAESKSQTVTQFLSSVSHDVRTPLSGIIGYTDLALHEDDPVKKNDYLEKIRSAGTLLTGLVNDTLDVSRIVSGKSHMNPVITNMKQVTDSVVVSASASAAKKGVHFESEIGDSLLPIRVDLMTLQKIILNLLTNAIKFTPKDGKVKLTVNHLDHRVNGCNFTITVEDTGVGMSKEFQQILFEPFSQEKADPEHLGAHEGMGLGMSIVRDAVAQMGGAIDVHSREGKGTKILVRLPIDVREDQPVSSAAERKPADYELLKGLKVLVAEDSDMNTEVVRAILARKGIEALCVENGEAAVKLFSSYEEGYFTAIFLDLRMPVMSGFEAATEIRSLDRPDAAVIPIYALSADVYAEDIDRAKEAGMNGHIAKPVKPEEIYNALLDALVNIS